MLFSSRWCPLDDLTASTLLINIPRIIFLHFQGDWHCHHKFCVLSPSSTYNVPNTLSHPNWLLQVQILTRYPSRLLAPAVFTFWSEGLWAGIVNLIQIQAFPHPIIHSSKLKPSFLIPNSVIFKAVSPRHPYSLILVGRHFQNYLSTFIRWLALTS